MSINILDISIANLIAAGEVVDRPASAIKEMLENSIDAGATKITVEIKNGGISLMRVTDNGCGMSEEDAKKCILRHATSKIKTATDLDGIATLGFRGEALAAISAVSRMRILTRMKDEDFGRMVTVENGEILSCDEAGGPFGTTVVVEDLFANVPARRKFLRRDATETASVSAVVEKIALSRPDVGIKYIADGTVKFFTEGDGKLRNVIASVFGRDFAKKLVPVEALNEGIGIRGYVGTPENVRGTRNAENFFINGRYVRCQTAMAALEQAFSSYIPKEKFPVAVLSVEFSPTFVDVNVHPQKLEVKFSDERPIFNAVYYGVRNALRTALPRPGEEKHTSLSGGLSADFFVKASSAEEAMKIAEKLNKPKNEQIKLGDNPISVPVLSTDIAHSCAGFPQDNSEKAVISTENGGIQGKNAEKSIGKKTINIHPQPVESFKRGDAISELKLEPELVGKTDGRLDPIAGGNELNYRIQGVVFNCYVMVETDRKLIVIDKHAAHERIIFERLKGNMSLENPPAQRLLLPMEVRLTQKELDTAEEYRSELSKVGFDYADGKIFSYPIALNFQDAVEVFSILVGRLAEGTGNLEADRRTMYEKALYQASCKAAVKAGREDLFENIDWIVREVLTRPEIRYCPHGRPVAIELGEGDFEKRFERK